MLPHLIRHRLLDLVWAADDLDAAAAFWLRLYRSAGRRQKRPGVAGHALEVRLRGIPRHHADAVVAAVADRLKEGAVGLRDADTVSVVFPPVPGDRPLPPGLGLAALAGPPFGELVAEVRVWAGGHTGRADDRTRSGATLVLVGGLTDGGLRLRAVWRSGPSGWEDRLMWGDGWAEQDEWLTALADHRRTGAVPDRLADRLFAAGPAADAVGRLAVWLIHVPLGRPRLGGLAARAVTFPAVFAAVGLGGWAAADAWLWPLLVPVGLAGWQAVVLAAHFARNEVRLLTAGRRQLRQRYARHYDAHARLVVSPDAGRRADPWAAKYTAELAAAGFAHAGDLELAPAPNGDIVLRVFYAPDGVTYLTVLLVLTSDPDPAAAVAHWPAAVAFLAHTHFADGGVFATLSGWDHGFRRKRTGPEFQGRVVPDADDPVDFVRGHQAAAAGFAADAARTPRRHEPLDGYVRRQQESDDDERRLYQADPWTWGDHLHWYLQRQRPAYRRQPPAGGVR